MVCHLLPFVFQDVGLTVHKGEVVHINVFGQDIIFLNSVRAANDLLDKRSAIYSDRPQLPLFNDL